MSEQISKLNRIGQNLNPAKSKFLSKPKFTIGKSPTEKSNTSSESEDDYDVSLYQPRPEPLIHLPDEDQDVVCANDASKPADVFLPSVGIVMRTQTDTVSATAQNILEMKENLSSNEASHINDVRLNSVMQNVFLQKGEESELSRSVSPTPEIRISESTKVQPPSSLKLDRKLSHSSGEVDVNEQKIPQVQLDSNLKVDSKFTKRSSSEHDIVINLSQSQSESALKQIKSGLNNITSPVASVTKDLVLSPFSKFAKGMQNLGVNLDPRKISKGGIGPKQVTERELEELKKLQEKWVGCKTRLIAL